MMTKTTRSRIMIAASTIYLGMMIAMAPGIATGADKEAKELSVAPSSFEQFVPPKPEWVDSIPADDGDAQLIPVTSVPCKLKSDCEESLIINMRGAAENYVESLIGPQVSETTVEFDDQWLLRHRSSDHRYEGTMIRGDETYYQVATMLRLTQSDDQWIRDQWRRNQAGQRLIILGGGVLTTVIALIALTMMLSSVTRRAEQRVTTSTV